MKLRNKKTGEIAEWDFGNWYQHILNPDNKEAYECTLSEFMDRTVEFREEWKDYEEPKSFWTINTTFDCAEPIVSVIEISKRYYDDKDAKSIGNYFETKEEAEKAVEKLKAWKRLKDFGCGFILDDHFAVKFVGPDARKITSAEEQKSLSDNYKLLFGGEDE